MEEVKYSVEDKLYLKSVRRKPWPHSHPNLVWRREEWKNNNISTISSIYGHSYWAAVSKNGVDYLRQNYHTQPNDVFITSFPRSGTHWIMKICVEIMRHCCHDIQKSTLPPEYRNADYRFIPQFEAMASKSDAVRILNNFVYRYNMRYPSLRFNFSHCPWHLFPAKSINRKTKIIHIVRDPKDTVTSLYKLVVDLNKAFGSNPDIIMEDIIKFEHIFKDFMDGLVSGGNWWSMLIEWYLAAKDPNNNILFLYYEDIIANPRKMIHKIGEFLLKDDGAKYLDHKLINDECILDRICSLCTFSNQKKSAKRGWEFVIRKGVIGDYKNLLTQKQIKLMDERARIKLRGMTDIQYNLDNVYHSML